MLYVGNHDKISAQNMSKLNDLLLKNGVSSTRYAIGISIDDKLCLDQNQGDKQWSVYYQERGSKMCHMQYPTFRDAAEIFVDRLVPIQRLKDAQNQFNEQFGIARKKGRLMRNHVNINQQGFSYIITVKMPNGKNQQRPVASCKPKNEGRYSKFKGLVCKKRNDELQ